MHRGNLGYTISAYPPSTAAESPPVRSLLHSRCVRALSMAHCQRSRRIKRPDDAKFWYDPAVFFRARQMTRVYQPSLPFFSHSEPTSPQHHLFFDLDINILSTSTRHPRRIQTNHLKKTATSSYNLHNLFPLHPGKEKLADVSGIRTLYKSATHFLESYWTCCAHHADCSNGAYNHRHRPTRPSHQSWPTTKTQKSRIPNLQT